jgi:hypothetical protein
VFDPRADPEHVFCANRAAVALMQRDPSLTLEGAFGLLTQFRDLAAEAAAPPAREWMIDRV